MRTNLFIFSALAMTLVLGSCNKKLKNDLEDVSSDLDATKAQLAANQALLDSIAAVSANNGALLSAGTPITVTINNANRMVDSVAFAATIKYDFMWDRPENAGYVEDNNDGTFDIFIERYATVEGSEYSYIHIDDWDLVSPIANNTVAVYASKYFAPTDLSQSLYWYTNGYLNHGSFASTLTINSFILNTTSRTLILDITSNTPENWAQGSTKNPESVNFKWSGTLVPSTHVSRAGNR
jgi:hypothetical protein